MRNTTLYLYEFDIDDFELQDDVAGYYESTLNWSLCRMGNASERKDGS